MRKALIVQGQILKSWDWTFSLRSMGSYTQYLTHINVSYHSRYSHTVTTLFRLSVVDNGGLYRLMSRGTQLSIHTVTHMSGDTIIPQDNSVWRPFDASLTIGSLVDVVVEEAQNVFYERILEHHTK